ncbi:ParA family protein [Merismopedia glauca]|uniref:Chromosome partitioning protein ParA n=1 Tax=Merismopedia glauca CCAP 1448/3 TaxID=1296344 RepID=A0A2T1BXP1_9CYAN|nr:ParA family protein [Merismopedia glauca]PSB00677.1 chromosome partitioning protein ParA [Merismopedia glauca CCAP 1448/3]
MKIITVTGYKGGVAKSTTAIHIATYFSDRGKTILVDGDPNRTALSWAQRGKLPFTVADERQAMKVISGNDYVLIDTPARPNSNDLEELAKGCDLLILPTIPDVVSLEPMLQTAKDLGTANYRALIVIVPPAPSKEGAAMRKELTDNGIPVFKNMIRRSVGFQKAAFDGIPVRDISDSRARNAWLDYQALGNEIKGVFGDE